MTYNILTGGQTAQAPARLAEICEVIRRLAPDVLVLNECNGFDREGSRELYRLEHELGMRAVLAPAQSGYHVVLLLRAGCFAGSAAAAGRTPAGAAAAELETEPARFIQAHSLANGLHHAAVVTRIAWGEQELTVIGAHLDPYRGEARLAEAELLTRHMGSAELVFLMGDLNSISARDAANVNPARWSEKRRQRHLLPTGSSELDTRAIAALERSGLVDVYQHLHPQTFRATAPALLVTESDKAPLRIDYIFASPRAAALARRAEIVAEPWARRASDHYPVFADFEL